MEPPRVGVYGSVGDAPIGRGGTTPGFHNMPYNFDKSTTPDEHLFAATAGSNAAREYLALALRDRDFPEDFTERGQGIYRRIVELDKDLEAHANSIRRRKRQVMADSGLGYVGKANWALLGVSNVVRELQEAVRKGGREYVRVFADAKGIMAELEPLVDDLREYAEGYHPLEWASRAVGDLAERIPQAFAQWTYAPPSLARVASRGPREYAVVVRDVHGDNVTVVGRGSGHAGLERGMVVPRGWLPTGRVTVGDEYLASWTPGPNGGKWSFSEMDFSIV